MNSSSSKDSMEMILGQLENIKRAEISDRVYDRIVERISKTSEKIPVVWVRAAAAVFLCLLAIEILSVNSLTKEKNKSEVAQLVPQSNNYLYNE
ncbi:MAG: hypothetical protein KDC83_10060 [Flavobacteriales bacterium]|nr:hypothetical protein [Flavobacteriales bacterium]